MSWERDLLLAIHQAQAPPLDAAFLLSHELGTIQFGVALVLALVLAHAARGERRAALLWLLVGLSTALLQWQIKEIVGRPRPQLWPWLLQPSGAAWPSGHALSTATFFPMLAWQAARRWPARALAAWATALGLVVVVATPDETNAAVWIVRAGAVSAGFNADQRALSLGFTVLPGQIRATAPASAAAAPPGPYLLFLVHMSGAPSLGRFVRLYTAPPPQGLPVITSSPSTTGSVESQYVYAPTATEPGRSPGV